MTEAILQTTEEQITCSICLDLFEEPKALPCLHTFCKKCITDHIEQHAHTESSSRGYRCPICRRFVPAPPNANLSPSSWSDKLEGNHMVVSLMEAYRTPRVKSKYACEEHDGQILELYCVDHKFFMCSLCALQHRKCSDIRTRDEAISSLQINQVDSSKSCQIKDAEQLIKLLFEQCNSIENLISDRKSKLLDIDRAEANIISEVAKQKHLVFEMLNCQEENIKAKLSKRKAKEVKKVETEIRKCEKLAERQKSSLTKLQRATECEDETSDSIQPILNVVKKDHESCRKKLITSSKKSLFMGFGYEMSDVLNQFIHSFETFGHLDVVKDENEKPVSSDSGPSHSSRDIQETECRAERASSVDDAPVPRPIPRPRTRLSSSQQTLLQGAPVSRGNGLLVRVEDSASLTVDLNKHKPCWITGIAILQNGDVILVDSQNERIMLYDDVNNLLSQIKVSPAPYDVTLISDTDVIISRPISGDGLLSCLIQDSTIELGGTLSTTITPYCVHYDSGTLGVCSNEEMQLYEKDDAVWTPTYSESFRRSKITYIAVDGREKKVYLTDQKYPRPQMLCVSFGGEILWRFVHKDLNFPTGVALCGNFVFVTSWDECTVLQLAKDGTYLGTVVNRNIQFPWKLAIGPSRNGSKLAISQYKNSLDKNDKKVVKFFQLDIEL